MTAAEASDDLRRRRKARKYTNLRVTRVDVVDRGANRDEATDDGAHILLFKRESQALEPTPTLANLPALVGAAVTKALADRAAERAAGDVMAEHERRQTAALAHRDGAARARLVEIGHVLKSGRRLLASERERLLREQSTVRKSLGQNEREEPPMEMDSYDRAVIARQHLEHDKANPFAEVKQFTKADADALETYRQDQLARQQGHANDAKYREIAAQAANDVVTGKANTLAEAVYVRHSTAFTVANGTEKGRA